VRVDNWTDALPVKIEEWRPRRLQYGLHDCFQFCADVYFALTGVDRLVEFPTYSSREEADAILAQYDGVVGLVTHVLGEPKAVNQCCRGDLIAADFGDGIAPGVCVGVHSCTIGPRGLAFVPTSAAICGWTV